jgi:hypothetical protein
MLEITDLLGTARYAGSRDEADVLWGVRSDGEFPAPSLAAMMVMFNKTPKRQHRATDQAELLMLQSRSAAAVAEGAGLLIRVHILLRPCRFPSQKDVRES